MQTSQEIRPLQRGYLSNLNEKKLHVRNANTLSMIYKQQRFWATSLKLEWLLILIANFGFDSKNITSVVAYFPFQNINVASF